MKLRDQDAIPRRLLEARVKLMLSQPYLASAIARYPVVDSTAQGWCETMATDGYYIYINSDFCESLETEEISFVFAHEVLHCLLGHIDRRNERDPNLWNQAIDYATNLMLVEFGLRMPRNGLIDRSFRGLTSEEIYKILQEEESKKGDGGGEASKLPRGEVWDIHLDPGDPRGMGRRAEEFPTEEERRRIRISLGNDLRSKLHGTQAGLFRSEIKRAGESRVSWRELMSRFFHGLRRDDYRLFPPNPKHVWRGIYLPSVGVPGPEHIIAVVDTSGSMSDDDLSQVLSELDRLRSVTNCRLTLIQCDAKLQQVEEYEAFEWVDFERTEIIGRGGTSFIPPFEWAEDRIRNEGMRPDALVYLTDGFGFFPRQAPPFPVLWIVTRFGSDSFPFGSRIEMNPAD